MKIKSNKYKILIPLLLLTLVSAYSCSIFNKWNSDFVKGKIDKDKIQKDLSIGSNYKDLLNYIKNNKIPKYSVNHGIGYSDKIYNTTDSFFDEKYINKVEYYISIDGHIDYLRFPHYYHPILYFYFDENDTLIHINQHGYS